MVFEERSEPRPLLNKCARTAEGVAVARRSKPCIRAATGARWWWIAWIRRFGVIRVSRVFRITWSLWAGRRHPKTRVRLQAKRIGVYRRRVHGICVQIHPAYKFEGILTQEPLQLRMVVPRAIEIRARAIVFASRKLR